MVSARAATGQGEGNHQSEQEGHALGAREATSWSDPNIISAQGAPLAGATGASTQVQGSHLSCGTRSATSARGATFQCEGCHLPEQTLPTVREKPATLAITVSGCPGTTCRVGVMVLFQNVDLLAQNRGSPRTKQWIPSHSIGAPRRGIRCSLQLPSRPLIREAMGASVDQCTRRANRVTLLMTHGALLALGRGAGRRNQALLMRDSGEGEARHACGALLPIVTSQPKRGAHHVRRRCPPRRGCAI